MKNSTQFAAGRRFDVVCLGRFAVDFYAQQIGARLEDVASFIARRIPAYQAANRGYLTVAVGCTGGQHRSVYLVDRLAARFAAEYPGVLARHTGLEPR